MQDIGLLSCVCENCIRRTRSTVQSQAFVNIPKRPWQVELFILTIPLAHVISHSGKRFNVKVARTDQLSFLWVYGSTHSTCTSNKLTQTLSKLATSPENWHALNISLKLLRHHAHAAKQKAKNCTKPASLNSLVCVASGLWSSEAARDSSVIQSIKTASETTQSPVQWLMEALSPRVNRPGRKVDHSHQVLR